MILSNTLPAYTKLNRQLRIVITILSITLLAFACKPESRQGEFAGTWTAVTKTANGYQIIDCDVPGEQITITSDSLLHRGIMEDISFKVGHVERKNNVAIYFPKKDASSLYRFTWADEKQGIAKCDIKTDGAIVTKFLVNQANARKVKTVKGDIRVCVNKSDAGDPVKDSLSIGDGSKVLFIEADDCLALRDMHGKQLLGRCFEAFILRIRPVKGNLLPLTFIAGSRSVDIDFYPAGDQWISKTATYFRPVGNHEEKVTRPYVVSIKDFEFDDIVTTFKK